MTKSDNPKPPQPDTERIVEALTAALRSDDPKVATSAVAVGLREAVRRFKEDPRVGMMDAAEAMAVFAASCFGQAEAEIFAYIYEGLNALSEGRVRHGFEKTRTGGRATSSRRRQNKLFIVLCVDELASNKGYTVGGSYKTVSKWLQELEFTEENGKWHDSQSARNLLDTWRTKKDGKYESLKTNPKLSDKRREFEELLSSARTADDIKRGLEARLGVTGNPAA